MPAKAGRVEVLNGWKEIADYLGKGLRTVQRYERQLNLPIHRPAGKSPASVLAKKCELDAWVAAAPIFKPLTPRRLECHSHSVILLRRRVEEFKKLRLEFRETRKALNASLETLSLILAQMRKIVEPTRDTPMLNASERDLVMLSFNGRPLQEPYARGRQGSFS